MTIKDDKYTFEQRKSKLKHDGQKLPFHRNKLKKYFKLKGLEYATLSFE